MKAYFYENLLTENMCDNRFETEQLDIITLALNKPLQLEELFITYHR